MSVLYLSLDQHSKLLRALKLLRSIRETLVNTAILSEPAPRVSPLLLQLSTLSTPFRLSLARKYGC